MKLFKKIVIGIVIAITLLFLPVFQIGTVLADSNESPASFGLLEYKAIAFPYTSSILDMFEANYMQSRYGDRVAICDGINDDLEIMAAYNQLSQNETMWLRDGLFNVQTNCIIADTPNALIQGNRGAIVKQQANQPAGFIIGITASTVTIKGFTLDGNMAEQLLSWQNYTGIQAFASALFPTVEDMEIRNVGYDGVASSGNNHNYKVQSCYIHNCGEGICFQQSFDCYANFNNVEYIGTDYGTTQDGIEWSSCIGGGGTNYIQHVSGSGYDIFNSSGVEIYGSVKDFDISQNQLPAVSIQGTTGTSDNNRIEVSIEKGGAGVAVYKGSYNYISCNIKDAAYGVYITDWVSLHNTINANIIQDIDNYGVRSNSPYTIITNNQVRWSRFVAYAAIGGNSIITGNEARETTLYCFSIAGNHNIITSNLADLGNYPVTVGIYSGGQYDIIGFNQIINIVIPSNAIQIESPLTTIKEHNIQ